MKIRDWILILIIIAAFFLRFWHLDSNPPSLTWDEAAWGYNAYSISLNGKDEFGNFLPVAYIESFGDFKPPMYAYLTVLPVKIFGLNEFSTRFASAFLGVLTVLLTYFLTKEILNKNLKSQPIRFVQGKISNLKTTVQNLKVRETKQIEIIAFFAAGILAISPWHILLSRAAFEANAATFFIVCGVYFFLLSTNRKTFDRINRGVDTIPPGRWNYIATSGVFFSLSILSFILSMYTFNTARVVAPILVFGLLAAKRKVILKMKKEIALSFIIGFILFIPLGRFLLSPQAKLRFNEVNIFSDLAIIARSNQEIQNDNNSPWSKIIHNRRFAYSIEYLRHYFDNLNPLFLFIRGDGNPKFSIQDVGQMYLWEIPFFIIGIFLIIRKKEGNWWIIPFWLAAGIIPAGVARETPHALRIESVLPTFQIITAYGLFHFWDKLYRLSIQEIGSLAKITLCKIGVGIIPIIAVFNFAYFWNNYFFHYPREFSGEWQYGYREAINFVKDQQDNFDLVYFTNSLGRPYIYFLYYLQYDPYEFLKSAKVRREVYGFVHVDSFGKYNFLDNLDKVHEKDIDKRILYVDSASRAPGHVRILKEFYLLNGTKTLVAYTK